MLMLSAKPVKHQLFATSFLSHTHTVSTLSYLVSDPVTGSLIEIIIAPWFNPTIPLGLLVLI